MLPTIEMTETLVFTLCKLELRGKEIALQSHSTEAYMPWPWSTMDKMKGKQCTKNKPMSKCFAVFESGSLLTLLSFAFFTPIFFQLTADTSRDEALAASLSEG